MDIQEKLYRIKKNKEFYFIPFVIDPGSPLIFIVNPLDIFISDDERIRLDLGSYGEFMLGEFVYEKKEEAIDALIKMKKEILNKTAKTFKLEQCAMERILNDVESVFEHKQIKEISRLNIGLTLPRIF